MMGVCVDQGLLPSGEGLRDAAGSESHSGACKTFTGIPRS